jgi:hypothetical protein
MGKSLSIPPSYRPDEPGENIFVEHTYLQGALLAAVAYGIMFILYCMTCFWLWITRHHFNSRRNLFFLCFISIIFVLETFYLAGLLEFTQNAFVDFRNIPGGPAVFESNMSGEPIGMLVKSAMVVNGWLCNVINVRRLDTCLLFRLADGTPIRLIDLALFCDLPGLQSPSLDG